MVQQKINGKKVMSAGVEYRVNLRHRGDLIGHLDIGYERSKMRPLEGIEIEGLVSGEAAKYVARQAYAVFSGRGVVEHELRLEGNGHNTLDQLIAQHTGQLRSANGRMELEGNARFMGIALGMTGIITERVKLHHEATEQIRAMAEREVAQIQWTGKGKWQVLSVETLEGGSDG